MSDEIWAGIKIFINDTLGTVGSKPLNKMLNEGISASTQDIKDWISNTTVEIKNAISNGNGTLSTLITEKASAILNKIDTAVSPLATQSKLTTVGSDVSKTLENSRTILNRVHGPETFLKGDATEVTDTVVEICNFTSVTGTIDLYGSNGGQTVLEITIDGYRMTELHNDTGRIFFLAYGIPCGTLTPEQTDVYRLELTYNDSIKIRAKTLNAGEKSIMGYHRKGFN